MDKVIETLKKIGELYAWKVEIMKSWWWAGQGGIEA